MYNSSYVGFASPRSLSSTADYSSGLRSTMNRDLGRYELDHIATFSNIGHKMRVPEDVLSQLRQLESAGQMFSMRIILVITQQSLTVVHAQSGETVEQFPMRCVINPYPYTNRQNLLMFTCNVGDTNEIHVFASSVIPATEIAERIRAAKVEWTQVGRDEFEDGAIPMPNTMSNNGFGDYFNQKRINGTTASPVYPQRYTTLMHSRAMNVSLTEQAYQFRAMRDLQFRNEQQNGLSMPPAGYQPYAPGQPARPQGPVETHTQVLNWCFDDLEKFVGQLYRAVQAFRELDKRVTARKQQSYVPGDGMLMRMARLPTDNELFEILQKFKFTLNLLGRLQQVLIKPNAADIVHKLMPFLRTIVDACDVPGQQPLSPSVVSPLLNFDVVTLLKHCLISEETEFWRSLGDAWCISRDEWKGGATDGYAPRFTNGYKLSVQEAEELMYGAHSMNGHSSSHQNGHGSVTTPPAYRLGALANEAAEEAQRRRDEAELLDNYSPRSRNPPAANGTQPSATATTAATANTRALEKLDELNRRYAAELRARGARAYEVINEYSPKNAKEINVLRGEVVEVLSDDRQWWKVRTAVAQVGFCPCTILRPLDPLPPRDYDDGSNAMRAQSRPSSLGNSDGLLGSHAVPPPPPPPAAPFANGLNASAYGDPRRLGMQPPSKAKVSPVSSASSAGGSGRRDDETLAIETAWADQNDLSPGAANPHHMPPVLGGANGRRTQPKILITSESSSDQVEEWLKSKFRPQTVTALAGLNGEQLFNAKIEYPNLLEQCSREDMKRLEDSIQLYKNLSGYMTVSKKQFNEILTKRRTLVERSDSIDDAMSIPSDNGSSNT